VTILTIFVVILLPNLYKECMMKFLKKVFGLKDVEDGSGDACSQIMGVYMARVGLLLALIFALTHG